MAAHVRLLRQRIREIERRQRPRVFPLEDLKEDEVFYRYRFKPQTIMFILSILPDATHPTQRNHPLPPLLQLLLCLRFLATGAIHLLIGDSLNVSRSTAGRCIRGVHRFPNVLGYIDGTHIKIKRPKSNESDFVNRKGWYSINVQMCCDAEFRITSCSASWPGSVHDSRIFRASALCTQFENGQHHGFLLGDSGYPCRPFLMTPFLNPENEPQEKYNKSLCRTRVVAEQTYDVLKRRFQCLHHGLVTEPDTAVTYTLACVILHNIGIKRRDILVFDCQTSQEEPVNVPPAPHAVGGRNDGVVMRNHIVPTFFS